MKYEVLKDFEYHSRVSDEIIEKFKGIIPEELMVIWKEYGFGSFFNGYLKIINPDDYKDILESTGFPDEVWPIMVTGLSDIIAWEKGADEVGLVKFRFGGVDMFDKSFSNFMRSLSIDGKVYWQNKFESIQYNEAVEKYGKIEYDECFGYVPMLALGGPETVDNLQKVKVMVHIDIMSQL